MPGRPVAQRIWNDSSSTGVSEWAFFGTGNSLVTAYVTSTSTKIITYAVHVSAGASTHQIVVLAAAASTSDSSRTSTGSVVFDKARVVVSANATTGDANEIWLAAGG